MELAPPTITSKPKGPAYADEEWSYQLAGQASDGGAVTFYLIDGDEEILIENGLLSVTWDEAGTQNLVIRAVDSHGGSIEQHVTLEVIERVVATNDPPVIYSIPTEQTRLDKPYRYQVKAFDPNGDTLTYSLAGPSHGASISKDGLLSWNPSVTGSYEFTILVSDGVNDPVAQTFTLTVLAPVTINTPPQITSVPTGGAMKDREYRYQATADDVDGDTITWSLDTDTLPEDVRGNLTIDAETGLLTWTPGVSGTFTFTVIASDGTDSVSQIVTLPVAANAPPQITGLPDPNITFGQEYVSQIIAHDPNGDAITYKLENAPAGLTVGADGTLTWENPTTGRYTVAVVVTDTSGATARREFQLNVVDPNVPNAAPSLVGSLPGSIPVGKSFTHQLGATDPENDPVTFKLVGDDNPAGLKISSSGRIEWTPTATGEVAFTIQWSDGVNIVTQELRLNVVAQRTNSAPVFTSKSPESVTVNKPYVYKPSVTDPDGDSLSISLVGSVPSGMSMNAQGEIVWTPTSAWAGRKVSFTLRATDTYGATTEQVVELNVRSVILAPNIVIEQLPVGKIGQEWTYQIKASDLSACGF